MDNYDKPHSNAQMADHHNDQKNAAQFLVHKSLFPAQTSATTNTLEAHTEPSTHRLDNRGLKRRITQGNKTGMSDTAVQYGWESTNMDMRGGSEFPQDQSPEEIDEMLQDIQRNEMLQDIQRVVDEHVPPIGGSGVSGEGMEVNSGGVHDQDTSMPNATENAEDENQMPDLSREEFNQMMQDMNRVFAEEYHYHPDTGGGGTSGEEIHMNSAGVHDHDTLMPDAPDDAEDKKKQRVARRAKRRRMIARKHRNYANMRRMLHGIHGLSFSGVDPKEDAFPTVKSANTFILCSEKIEGREGLIAILSSLFADRPSLSAWPDEEEFELQEDLRKDYLEQILLGRVCHKWPFLLRHKPDLPDCLRTALPFAIRDVMTKVVQARVRYWLMCWKYSSYSP